MPIFTLLPLDGDGGWCESRRAKRERRIKGRIRGYGAAVMRLTLIYIQTVFWSGCESMELWACPSDWTRNSKTQKGESRAVDLYRSTESLPGRKSPATDGRTDSLFWGFSFMSPVNSNDFPAGIFKITLHTVSSNSRRFVGMHHSSARFISATELRYCLLLHVCRAHVILF